MIDGSTSSIVAYKLEVSYLTWASLILESEPKVVNLVKVFVSL